MPDVYERAKSYITDTTDRFMPTSVNASELSDTPARVLVVTHGGFIREFLNVVHDMKGEPLDSAHQATNTAVYNVRFQRNDSGGLVPEVLLSNDNSHT